MAEQYIGAIIVDDALLLLHISAPIAGWVNIKMLNDILQPYAEIDYGGIQYGTCRDYDHVSRYKKLRQVAHNPDNIEERYIALETFNPFESGVDVIYYQVPQIEENRLDIIAEKLLGSSKYSWILSYFNKLADGYTVRSGQTIMCPKSFSSLFGNNEILSSINPLQLNLGSE